VSEGDTVTVVLGAFEPLLSGGLEMLLSGDAGVHVVASDIENTELEDVVARHRPHVVIVGETVEYDLLARLKASLSVAGVLVIAQALPPLYGTLLLTGGVSCLARSTVVDDLFAAIRSAAVGEPTFAPTGAGRVVRRRRGEGLTPREIEVLEHLRIGRGYAPIARELHLAPETVRSHTANICRKLRVAGRYELIGMPLPIGDTNR
jgi:DNA-binding NarL/FixJ family response regulator